MQQLDDPQMVFNDLFCGGGGVTTGVEEAEVFNNKAAKVITCVNHDANAIRSHAANHPHCQHYTEDIRTLDLTDLSARLRAARQMYPRAKMCLWGSVECQNFSKAKGALPKNADSRTLAEHLDRYVEAEIPSGGYDYIFIENVEEFMTHWGPLDKNGKLLPGKKDIFYKAWVQKMKSYGYEYDYRILNAADFGAYTSRKRYFGVFYRPNLPIVWPKQTHAKKPTGDLQPWKAVRDVLDLHMMGENIFGRKKGYAENTLERIYEGLQKHIGETHNGAFFDYYYGNGYSSSLDMPSGTLTTKDRINLVHFLLFPQWGPKCSHSIDKPSPVLPARMDKMCPYVIDAEHGEPPIEIKPGDSYFTVKIKEFMNKRGIREVRMRGISIPEMLRIMGFDENYILIGTIAERKKYIGNAVAVRVAKVIIESFAASLCQPFGKQLAA